MCRKYISTCVFTQSDVHGFENIYNKKLLEICFDDTRKTHSTFIANIVMRFGGLN